MFGTRPMETINLSKFAALLGTRAVGVFNRNGFPGRDLGYFYTGVDGEPCFAKTLAASAATCSSAAPRKTGSASSIVTSAPSRRHTLPISSPITPAPITPRRFGHFGERERTAIGKDQLLVKVGTRQRARQFEPVAMIACFASNVSAALPVTLISQPSAPALTKLPRPWKNSTLFFLKR